MDTSTFRLLCQRLRDKKLLRDTQQVSVEEAVAEFMHTIAHSVRNMTNSFRFFRSGETISQHFQKVLYTINKLAPGYFVQAEPHTPKGPYGFEVYFLSKITVVFKFLFNFNQDIINPKYPNRIALELLTELMFRYTFWQKCKGHFGTGKVFYLKMF